MSTNSTYSDKLKNPKWQKKRLSVLNRDKWKCKLCGDADTNIQVHHTKYVGANPWDTPDEFLISICEHCHQVLHELKDEEVVRVTKERMGDSLHIFAHTQYAVFLLYFFNGSPITLITQIPSEIFKRVSKNIPKPKKILQDEPTND